MDKVPETATSFKDKELTAVDRFQNTVCILPDGRYQVELPRKEPLLELGESRSVALHRSLQNERSLARKGKISEFNAVLDEYLSMDHAEAVPVAELSKPHSRFFDLRMHGVSKESSSTTKLKIVFDGSANTSNGISLNDSLLTGPNLYPLISTILTQFCSYKYVISGDISKMFREIVLHPKE